MKILIAVVVLLLGLSVILSDSIVNAKKKKKELLYIDHKAYYIVPTSFSFKSGSPCSQFRYHNGSFRCFVMNINKFIDYHDDTDDMYNIIKYNRLLVFLSGVHYVNYTQRQQLSDKPSFWVNITGVGNVTIVCMSEFHFLFDDIQHIMVDNVHFMNCSKGDSKTTFTLNVMRVFGNDIFISFKDVQISGTNITGVKVNINRAVKWAQVRIRIIDSVISTGTTGVHIVSEQHLPNKNSVAYTMNVARTSFNTSCFALQSRYSRLGCGSHCKNNVLKIENVTFLGYSTCSSVVSFLGDMEVTLSEVLFMATKSHFLIQSVIDSLTMKGHCNFYENKGTVLFEAHIDSQSGDPYTSELVFLGATVKFVNNTIDHEGKKTIGTVMAVKDSYLSFANSNVSFENNTIDHEGKKAIGTVMAVKDSYLSFASSNVSFVNNYGTNCGGITITNTNALLSKNVNITFIGNEGKVSGALSFYSSSILSDHNSPSKLLLYRNKGPAIVSSGSELFFAKLK